MARATYDSEDPAARRWAVSLRIAIIEHENVFDAPGQQANLSQNISDDARGPSTSPIWIENAERLSEQQSLRLKISTLVTEY